MGFKNNQNSAECHTYLTYMCFTTHLTTHTRSSDNRSCYLWDCAIDAERLLIHCTTSRNALWDQSDT